jgi:hypothetical protein
MNHKKWIIMNVLHITLNEEDEETIQRSKFK